MNFPKTLVDRLRLPESTKRRSPSRNRGTTRRAAPTALPNQRPEQELGVRQTEDVSQWTLNQRPQNPREPEGERYALGPTRVAENTSL